VTALTDHPSASPTRIEPIATTLQANTRSAPEAFLLPPPAQRGLHLWRQPCLYLMHCAALSLGAMHRESHSGFAAYKAPHPTEAES